jgi:hypothetical protein
MIYADHASFYAVSKRSAKGKGVDAPDQQLNPPDSSNTGRHRTLASAARRPTQRPASAPGATSAADPWEAPDSPPTEGRTLVVPNPWTGEQARARPAVGHDEPTEQPTRRYRTLGAALSVSPAPVGPPVDPRPVITPNSTVIPAVRRRQPSLRLIARGGVVFARRRAVTWVVACLGLVAALIATGTAHGGEIASRVGSAWVSGSQAHALPTPIGGFWDAPIAANVPPPPSYTDAGHYVAKYGFDWPSQRNGLWNGEQQRLADMLPFAIAATARWNARHGDALEPQMLLFWTHAEGISGRVSYSNCANEAPPAGTTFFTHIANCDVPSFWQLGYGNQFGVIAILKEGFSAMRGDPNDAKVVQHVGQQVLDWDRSQGAVPACGGYSCTFPTLTIDQLMAGVSLDHETENDWWASVLSRDPGINAYMLARALVWFSHDATRNWVGCYYAEPCWGEEANRLQEVLSAWDSIVKTAHLST